MPEQIEMQRFDLQLPDGRVVPIETEGEVTGEDYAEMVRQLGIEGPVKEEFASSVPAGMVYQLEGEDGLYIAKADGQRAAFTPIEQRPFLQNIASNPNLTNDEARDIARTYLDTYYDSIKDDKTALGRISESFKQNAINSFFNATTLGADIAAKQVGTNMLGGGPAEAAERTKEGVEILEQELARREKEGRDEPKSALYNVFKTITSGDTTHMIRQLPDEELKKRLEFTREQANLADEKLGDKAYKGLLNEAKRVARFDALDSSGVLEKGAALTGALLGSAPTPESLIAPARGVTVLGTAGKNALVGGGINLVTSPLVQGSQARRGVINDPTVKAAVIDAGLGAVIGFSISGGHRLLGDWLNIDPNKIADKSEAEIMDIIRSKNKGKTDEQILEQFIEIDNPELKDTINRVLQARVRQAIENVEQAKYVTDEGTMVQRAVDTITEAPPDTKPRGMIERIKNFPQFKQAKAAMEANPEMRYDQQRVREARKAVTEMDDGELVSVFSDVGLLDTVTSDNNLATIAGAELLERARLAGQDTRPVVDLLAKRGTTLGQLINQYKEIRSATPEGLLMIVRRAVEKADRKMNTAQEEKFIGMAEEMLNARKRLREAENALDVEFGAETVDNFHTAQSDLARAKKDLELFSADLVPSTILETTGKAIQGNLLTPLSIAANVIGNTAFVPLRTGVSVLSSALDSIYSRSTGKKRVVRSSPQTILAGTRGALRGIREATAEFFTGPGEMSYRKGEVQRGFRPVRSLMQAITGEGIAVDANGNVRLSDRARKAYEALVGVPPEIMFRMLNIGDKPFRRAREASLIEEQIALQGLKGKQADKFRLLGGLTEGDRAGIQEEALEAVFMQSGGSARHLNRLLDENVGMFLPKKMKEVPLVRDSLKFMGRINIPFRQFPVNYVSTALNFAVPPLAGLNAIIAGGMGNRRKAFQHLGEMAIGQTIYAATDYLYDKGLMSEPASKDRKERSVQYETFGPGRLNISGLNRLMNGEDPTYQRGDLTTDYTRAGGIAGVLMGIRSDRLASEKKDQEGPDPNAAFRLVQESLGDMAGVASFAFDQSFLSGTNAFLEAMRDPDPESGKVDRWMQNMFKAVSTVAMPNSIEAVARSQAEYIPDLQGDTLGETFKSMIDFKMSPLVKMLGEDPESFDYKLDLFGQPIERTPRGRNPIVYNMLDVSKTGRQPDDPFRQRLLEVFQQTGDLQTYPQPPPPSITYNGVTTKLDRDDWNDLQKIVGETRLEAARKLLAGFDANPRFNELKPEQQAAFLVPILNQYAYQPAGELARKQFLSDRRILNKYFPEQMGLPADKNRKSRKSYGRRMEDVMRDLVMEGMQVEDEEE